MRKTCLAALLGAACAFHAQAATQLFMPKTVYVGDTAELRYLFQTEADLFADRDLRRIELSSDYPALRTAGTDRSTLCYIKSAEIERSGSSYTLVITLVPWKAGEIDFLPFDLAQWIRVSRQTSQYGASYDVDFAPVTIRSLVRSLQVSALRPSSAPLVVPGTTTLLVLLGVCAIAVLSLLISLLLRLGALSAFLRSRSEAHALKKYAKAAIKKLRRLQRSDSKHPLDIRTFSGEIQHIIRSYLDRRFNASFGSLTTPAVERTCRELLGGGLSEIEEPAVESLTVLLIRTDYVRFAAESGASDSDKVPLLKEAVSCIASFAERKESGDVS